ncbi:MAG: patatin-like phospholipase family protein [Rubrivivax sp.]|nr:patatin-like phospholipase family protein [Rubrivivax sp.]
MPARPATEPHHDQLLQRHLRDAFGELSPAAIELLLRHLEWVEIAGGATLMSQGEPGDAMYLVVSGRLRAYIAGDDGVTRPVREIARGQIVGEMSMYTDEPRSATLIALRDSVLVRLRKEVFRELLASSAQVSVALTRQIIARLQTEALRPANARPVTVGLFAITEGVELSGFAQRLASALSSTSRVAVVDAARVDRELGRPGLARQADGAADPARSIAMHLDGIEASHDVVLLLADDAPSAWSRLCARHSDELLLLADADRPSAVHPLESECLAPRSGRPDADEILVLLHPAERQSPRGTAAWLQRRPVADHVHVRPALDRDMARLARLVSRTAVGLVFAGGGARGLAHLGVWKALVERGIEVDVVGGTSIGAIMASLVAVDQPLERTLAVARKAFSDRPTGDFAWLPLVSLIKGRRLERVVRRAMVEMTGSTIDVEDTWKGFYAIATNYSRAREEVLRRGPLLRALLASVAIPGALPPVVVGGELLCDGGTFNNFPVDVMHRMRGVGRVIGVDLDARKPRLLASDEIPGTWALLRDRLRPRRSRRYRLPSLPAYLMNVTILYSVSRQREARRLTHLHFNPPLERVGMLQWDRFDEIVRRGHEHACAVLDAQAAPEDEDD